MLRQYTQIFQSEIYKILHSSLLYVHLLIPVLGMTVFLSYFSFASRSEVDNISLYIESLALVFPFLIAVVTAMSSEMEAHAGFFQRLLTVPFAKSKIHLSRLLILLIMGFLATILAVMGFAVIFIRMGNHGFSASFYAEVAVLLFIGNLPLYLLHYMLSFSFHKGVGIGIGIVGSLLSALMVTGLGDNIWFCVPWGISMRLCCILLGSQVLGKDFFIWPGVDKSFIYITVASIVLLIVLVLWCRRWEAPQYELEA